MTNPNPDVIAMATDNVEEIADEIVARLACEVGMLIGKRNARIAAQAAYSILSPKLEAASLASEVRAIAEDSNYSNEAVGIAVRNWFHRASLAPEEKRS